jgi:hypothetical protein
LNAGPEATASFASLVVRADVRWTVVRASSTSVFSTRRARAAASSGAAGDKGAWSPRALGTIQSSSHASGRATGVATSVQHALHSALMKRSNTAACASAQGAAAGATCARAVPAMAVNTATLE